MWTNPAGLPHWHFPRPQWPQLPQSRRAILGRQRLQLVTAGFPERHAERACVAQPGLARNQPSDDLDYETAGLESMSLSGHPWRPCRDLEQRCQETCDHGNVLSVLSQQPGPP